ncbi:hypothetical protein F5B20DRAFT_563417 [Whalleya microplaca]|nr:hypothetical protein F5B20DRAFT_563417 [Whalleya microplaca]
MASAEECPKVVALDEFDESRPSLFADAELPAPAFSSPPPSSPSLSEDDDTETVAGGARDADALSITSMESFPDFTGRRALTIQDDQTKTVYEAWEIVISEDTTNWSSWKTFCGINFGIRWKSYNDGFLTLNPVMSFEQGELADLHDEAIREYEAKRSKKNKGKSYVQDLANRAYKLPADVYNKIQYLMDDKVRATNKTPFRLREWHVIMLQKGEFQMTELLPERKKRGLFRKRRDPAAIRKWFVVLQGEETKVTKERGGWRAFGRHSNPWWRIDARDTREARKEYRQHLYRQHFENVNLRRQPVGRASYD